MKERMRKIFRTELVMLLLMIAIMLADRMQDFVGKSAVFGAALALGAALCVQAAWKARVRRRMGRVPREHFLMVDAMTGLYNHRKVNDILQEIVTEAQGRGEDVALLYFDLDDLRPINDNYGFAVGDQVLQHVVNILRDGVRTGDVIGRYAGDEFLMILPGTTFEEANRIAGRLQYRLNETPFHFSQYEEALPVTVSIGIAHFPVDAHDAKTLLERAISSQEAAKRQGKAKIRHVQTYMEIEKYVQDSPKNLELYIRALKDKDTYTVEHSEDVARYSLLLADALALPDTMKKEIRIAGLFHDIGKILIPDSILKKPGRLSDEEYNWMQQHVVLSHEILSEHYTSETMKQAVVCHHERFDGGGYPLGLKAYEIPLVGRILAIADAYSAMTLDRAYRKSKTYEDGLAEIRRCAGTQFDPELAELFCSEIERQQGLLTRPLEEFREAHENKIAKKA